MKLIQLSTVRIYGIWPTRVSGYQENQFVVSLPSE